MAAALSVVVRGPAGRYLTTVVLAVAMGAQNVTVHRLAVADLTTTVLTLTLTGLAADSPDLGSSPSHTVRRLAAVASMLAGAVGGAIVVLHAATAWALVIAAVLLAVVTVGARFRWRQPNA